MVREMPRLRRVEHLRGRDRRHGKGTIAHADKVTVNLNDNVFIIYEKTDIGLKRTENGQADYVKQTDYAVCVNILRG